MAAARVMASPSYLNQQQTNRMSSPTMSRRTNSQTPTAASVGRRVVHTSRSPSRQPGVSSYRRQILFLLNPETNPEFPFCEASYQAHSSIRWPPWPHRLDSGHPKVFVILISLVII